MRQFFLVLVGLRENDITIGNNLKRVARENKSIHVRKRERERTFKKQRMKEKLESEGSEEGCFGIKSLTKDIVVKVRHNRAMAQCSCLAGSTFPLNFETRC